MQSSTGKAAVQQVLGGRGDPEDRSRSGDASNTGRTLDFWRVCDAVKPFQVCQGLDVPADV